MTQWVSIMHVITVERRVPRKEHYGDASYGDIVDREREYTLPQVRDLVVAAIDAGEAKLTTSVAFMSTGILREGGDACAVTEP